MILDAVSRLDRYAALNPLFLRAAEYLRRSDLNLMADGRYEISGEDAFLTLTRSSLRLATEAPLEAHRLYADIQIVLSGEEGYGWRSIASCTAPRGTFCAERDILFYDDRPDTFLTLRPGGMAVFFPSDAHAPLIGSGEVRKCIVKVRC